MFFTSAAVLVVGIARRYLGASPAGHSSPVSAKLSSFVTGGGKADAADPAEKKTKPPRRRHTAGRRAEAAGPGDKATARSRTERPTKRAHPHGSGMPGRRTPPRSSNGRRSRSAAPPPTPPGRRTCVRAEAPPPGHRGSVRRRGSRPRRASPASRPASASAATNAPRAGPATTSTSRARAAPTIRFHGCGTAAAIDSDEPEYRPRRRPSRDTDADRWEYDI